MRTSRHRLVARNIAATLLSGVWTRHAMTVRLRAALGTKTRKSQQNLVAEILSVTTGPYPPSMAALSKTIANVPSFERAAGTILRGQAPLHMEVRPPKFAPVAILRELDIPPLPTPGDIAAWLGLSLEQLDWFTDERRQHPYSATLRLYVPPQGARPATPDRGSKAALRPCSGASSILLSTACQPTTQPTASFADAPAELARNSIQALP
jgi:hypothetical protein